VPLDVGTLDLAMMKTMFQVMVLIAMMVFQALSLLLLLQLLQGFLQLNLPTCE